MDKIFENESYWNFRLWLARNSSRFRFTKEKMAASFKSFSLGPNKTTLRHAAKIEETNEALKKIARMIHSIFFGHL